MILKFFPSFFIFISFNFESLAALPTNDNFNKSRKVNLVEYLESAKEKLILKDYDGVINLLYVNIRSRYMPDSYLAESLINKGNAYFYLSLKKLRFPNYLVLF